ncbi:MAG: hypothetical protein ACLPX7_05950 [Xanthobacteraceae bacterium]
MREPCFVRFASVALVLTLASFVAFPSLPDSAPLWLTTTPPVNVDRMLKGDRLPFAAPIDKSHPLGSPAAPEQARFEKIPVGCDRAFSPISAPRLANIFQRCTV